MKKQLTATAAAVVGSLFVASATAASFTVSGEFRANWFPVKQESVSNERHFENSATQKYSPNGRGFISMDNDRPFNPTIFHNGLSSSGNSETGLSLYREGYIADENFATGAVESDNTFVNLGIKDEETNAAFVLRVYAAGFSRAIFDYQYVTETKDWTADLHLEHTFDSGSFMASDTPSFNRDNYVTLTHSSGFFVKAGHGHEGEAQRYKGLSTSLLDDEGAFQAGNRLHLANYVEQHYNGRHPYMAVGYKQDMFDGELVASADSIALGKFYSDGATTLDTTADSGASGYNLMRVGINGGFNWNNLEIGSEINMTNYKIKEKELKNNISKVYPRVFEKYSLAEASVGVSYKVALNPVMSVTPFLNVGMNNTKATLMYNPHFSGLPKEEKYSKTYASLGTDANLGPYGFLTTFIGMSQSKQPNVTALGIAHGATAPKSRENTQDKGKSLGIYLEYGYAFFQKDDKKAFVSGILSYDKVELDEGMFDVNGTEKTSDTEDKLSYKETTYGIRLGANF